MEARPSLEAPIGLNFKIDQVSSSVCEETVESLGFHVNSATKNIDPTQAKIFLVLILNRAEKQIQFWQMAVIFIFDQKMRNFSACIDTS